MWWAAAISVALIVAGLWTWQGAMEISVNFNTPRPELTAWAARCGALAGVALAQVLIIHFICGGLYARRTIDRILKWGCGTLCLIAALGAVGLGMAAGH